MKPLRLLAVIEASSITGPAKNLLQFALGAQGEIETTIATFTRGQPSNLFTDTVQSYGIPLEIIAERGLYDPQALSKLQSLVRRLQPHVLQTHAVKSHFLARSAKLHSLAPWIAFHHGYTWPSMRARAYNQLDRWSLRAARKVLTVSRPFKDEVVARGVRPENIEIVHNAISPDWGSSNPDEAAALRIRWGIAPDRNVILIVGRLSREKDHLTLLHAVHQLPASCNPHLLLVGEGPERAAIEDQIQRLQLTDRVTLTGHQPSAEPFYRIANVAVLSSLSEGSPNALLEAMAANVPVVATPVGGIPEIVTHQESALLVEPGDVSTMSTAIQNLIESAGLAQQLVSRSRELIRQRHTPEARIHRLSEIYRAVAAQLE